MDSAQRAATWSPGSRVGVPPGVLARSAHGEVVLLNLADENYYGLDAVGSAVWELITTGQTFAEVVTELLGRFDVDRAVLEADIAALLDDLVAHGLLVRS